MAAAALYQAAAQRLMSGDLDGAIADYQRCIDLEPTNLAALNNLGVTLIRAGRFPQAVDVLERALTLQPSYPRALTNLGKAMRETGRLPEAIARLRQAVSIEPGHAAAWVNLGEALSASGELDEAEQVLDRAIQVAPALVEAHMTLGMVKLQTGRVRESIHTLQSALNLAPNHADVHSNLAHALFISGDWPAAWPHFEHRFHRHSYRGQLRVPADMPRWDGKPGMRAPGLQVPASGLASTSGPAAVDRELWLIGEQGLGDQLQFARYAAWVREQGMRCVISCDPRLVKLLAAAGLADEVVPFGSPAPTAGSVAVGSVSSAADAHATQPVTRCFAPMLSMPLHHGTTPANVPLSQGYLKADESRIAHWRTRLSDMRGLRISLAWAGNPLMETGRYIGRSPQLAALEPLMQVSGVSFVSVQKHAGEDQLNTVPFGTNILHFSDLDTNSDAFLDTAAVLKSTDLLITSDTSIAHLGGALGVPTWVCLTHEPDWRWMRTGATTPWYNSIRLFRQPAPGDWTSVFTAVAGALS